VTVDIEPRFWGDVSLEQLHQMLGTEDQPVDDLYRVCEVFATEATRLLDAASQHSASWAELLAHSNDTALVAAYRRAEGIRLRLEALAEFLTGMSARIELLTEQFVEVRGKVARLYREVAEAEPPWMLGWLVQAGPQRADAESAARTEAARRLMREYDENTCEVLRRWWETVTPVEHLSTPAYGTPQRMWAVAGAVGVQEREDLDSGDTAGTSAAFAGSDEDTMPRHAAGAGFGRWTPPPSVSGRWVDSPTEPVSRADGAGVGPLSGLRGDWDDEYRSAWWYPTGSNGPRTVFDADWEGVPPVIGAPTDDDGPLR
jgi:hypothetical protein